jgi:myo-inositol 2-dehydrogenase / D-chiro-inositol 1-dehydrogenase
MNIRAGIVGAGRMGRERVRAARLLGAQISFVCDPDIERARILAADADARCLRRTEDIDFGDIDALFVCTPPAIRSNIATAAVSAGVALFIEKPVALDAAQALGLLDAVRTTPVINAVGYMNRYRSSVLSARRQAQHSLPIAVAFQWLAARYRAQWWLDRSQSGGPINEQCTHYIDLCRFLLGEISDVYAVSRSLADTPDSEGTAAITLRFDSGLIGTGLYSCEASQKQMAFEVFFPDRSVRMQGWDLRLSDDSAAEDIFLKELAAFFQALTTGDPSFVLSDIDSALKTQAVIDAIRRAMQSGRPERILNPQEAVVCA